MSEQVGSVTHKKSSDFHGGIRFQSSFTIRWELEDKNFLKIDIIYDSLKYRIMAIKTNENFIPFSNNVTFRKPRGTDLVTASELIPGFCRSKSNVSTPGSLRTIKSPTAGIVPGIKSPPLARTPPPPPAGFTLIGALIRVLPNASKIDFNSTPFHVDLRAVLQEPVSMTLRYHTHIANRGNEH